MSFDPLTCKEMLRKLLLSSDKPLGSWLIQDRGGKGGWEVLPSGFISYCHQCPGDRGRGCSDPQPFFYYPVALLRHSWNV